MIGTDMRRFALERAGLSASCFDSTEEDGGKRHAMPLREARGDSDAEEPAEEADGTAAAAATPADDDTDVAAAAKVEAAAGAVAAAAAAFALVFAAAAARPAAASIGWATFHLRMKSRLFKSARRTGVGMRVVQQAATIATAVDRLIR